MLSKRDDTNAFHHILRDASNESFMVTIASCVLFVQDCFLLTAAQHTFTGFLKMLLLLQLPHTTASISECF